jgi:DNA replication and repair protein RecF
MDQLVAALWPLRAGNRRHYSQVLAQRNALLGRIRAGRAAVGTLAAWDRELAAAAIQLRGDRAQAVELVTDAFAARAEQLGCTGPLRLEYRPRTRAGDEAELCAELRERLPGDLERGFTGHGPHRDELAISRDGRELRTYGSQGEQRLALLALLLAERQALGRERGRTPLMLLDDVMSELDGSRRELLAEDLARAGQSVLATTDLAHVPGAMDSGVARLRVSPGAILQEAIAA